MSIDTTLQERGTRYGPFHGRARITQNLKHAMRSGPNWKNLTDDKKEALEMIACKIGRILNGDPDYADSWHDIGGYAKLIEQKLEFKETEVSLSPMTQSINQARKLNDLWLSHINLEPRFEYKKEIEAFEEWQREHRTFSDFKEPKKGAYHG